MRRIQSLPLSLRPREKILKQGAAALSLEELLCVILVTGTKNNSVSKLATNIAKLAAKATPTSKELLAKLGLGPSKVAQVLAALELGKRLDNDAVVTLASPTQVFAHAYDIVREEKESLLCFYLNARGEMLRKEVVAVGPLNRVNLLPREIFSLIKEIPVAAIILAHNHPSGNLEPSKDDILFTKRVKAAADILGIQLLDHLIVSPKGWQRIKF